MILFSSSALGETLSLVQISQLLVTIPLMNIKFPANVQTVFKNMQGMVTFDFIDLSSIPILSVLEHFI